MKRIFNNQKGNCFITLVRSFIIIVLILISLLLMTLLFRKSLNNIMRKEVVTVPRIIGLTQGEASEILRQKGLELNFLSVEFNAEFDEGKIFFQTPDEGKKVKKSRRIGVRVSKGRYEVSVENVRGMSLRKAEILLINKHFIIGKRSYIRSDRIKPDHVIAQSPLQGSLVARRTPVSLLVSSGSGTDLVTIPNYMNWNILDAKKDLLKEGLSIGNVSYIYRDGYPDNVILAQFPDAFSEVLKGSELEFLVNSQEEFEKGKNKVLGSDSVFYDYQNNNMPQKKEETGLNSDNNGYLLMDSATVESVPQKIKDPYYNDYTGDMLNEDPVYNPAKQEKPQREFNISFTVPGNSEIRKVDILKIENQERTYVYRNFHPGGDQIQLDVQCTDQMEILIYIDGKQVYSKLF